MNPSARHHTTRRSVLTGWVCAVVLLIAPATASAVPSGWLIPAGDGQCYDGTPEEGPSVHHFGLSAAEPTAAESSTVDPTDEPCSIDTEADASSALCFEAAGAQISTIPELLASARGREMANDIVSDMKAELATSAADDRVEPLAFSDPEELPGDDSDDGKISCTTHPAECHSLPPAPSPVQIDSTLPQADVYLLGLMLDDLPEPPQMRPLVDTDLGPSPGHGELPEPPPRHV